MYFDRVTVMELFQFCRAYLHSAVSKKKMTSVVERIGFSAAQAKILNVLGKCTCPTVKRVLFLSLYFTNFATLACLQK